MDNHLEKGGESTPKINTTRRALECMVLFSILTYIRLVIEDWFRFKEAYPFPYNAWWVVFQFIILYLYLAYR